MTNKLNDDELHYERCIELYNRSQELCYLAKKKEAERKKEFLRLIERIENEH